MTSHRAYKWLILLQAGYTGLTALWALVDIESFMQVTGPKTDVWLVKTVGLLLAGVSVCLVVYFFMKADQSVIGTLAAVCSICLAGIDFYYAGKKVISPVYLIDGIIQVIFFIAWIIIAL